MKAWELWNQLNETGEIDIIDSELNITRVHVGYNSTISRTAFEFDAKEVQIVEHTNEETGVKTRYEISFEGTSPENKVPYLKHFEFDAEELQADESKLEELYEFADAEYYDDFKYYKTKIAKEQVEFIDYLKEKAADYICDGTTNPFSYPVKIEQI